MIDRHRCEVRAVLAMRDQSQRVAMEYLEKVSKARGKEAATQLQKDCADQWGKGNRGEWEMWI